MAQSQRERLLTAMAEAVGAKGYADTSVADVLERAGVSRATFYALFRDKQDCFRAAYEAGAELIAEVLADALGSMAGEMPSGAPGSPLDRLDHVLRTYLDLLHDAPAMARTFLVEVYAVGPAAIDQRQKSLEHFVDLVAETHRGESGLLGTRPEQRFAAEVLVGAVSSMVTNMVGVGDIDGLPALREPLMVLARDLTGRDRP